MDCVKIDVQGILSLYEASNLRLHGEVILDEALAFATTQLTSLTLSLKSHLAEQIIHALKRPLNKTATRLGRNIKLWFMNPIHHIIIKLY